MVAKTRDSRAHKINWAFDKIAFVVLGAIGTMALNKLDGLEGEISILGRSIATLQQWAYTVGEQLHITLH